MSISLYTVRLQHDEDVVLARQRAGHIASLLGCEAVEQTRIATAVSEIVRNARRYAKHGEVEFLVNPDSTPQQLDHLGRLQEFQYPMPPGSILVLHSDGLSGGWDLASYPGLQSRHPSVIAGVLFRDFSRRRDDVTVVVAKDRPPLGG